MVVFPTVKANSEYADDLEAEEYQEMVRRAVIEFNQDSNDTYRWIPMKVLSVHSMFNIGIRFIIKVAMAPSNCTKTIHTENLPLFKPYEKCEPINTLDWKACTFEVFQFNWKVPEKVTLITCSNYNQPSQASSKNCLKSGNPFARWKNQQRSPTAWHEFLRFIKKFKRVYSSMKEQIQRFKTYKQNMRLAGKLQFEERGSAIYGETQFSDLTSEEFRKIMLPSLWPTKRLTNDADFNLDYFNLSLSNLPRSFDWQSKGVITAVKDQGPCGSCWAFSVTGNIEGLYAIKSGKLISLSEQELIDCDVVDKGCNGGLPINAFREIIRMGGLEPEDLYPYKAKNGTCHLVRSEIAVTIDDAVEIPRNETIMQAWVAQRGPISVGIDAELLAYYKSGILHPPRKLCPPSMINHGVLITGYGFEDGLPYWIIKNSWGAKWGEDGYFRLLRGKDVCGVRDLASSAIIN